MIWLALIGIALAGTGMDWLTRPRYRDIEITIGRPDLYLPGASIRFWLSEDSASRTGRLRSINGFTAIVRVRA